MEFRRVLFRSSQAGVRRGVRASGSYQEGTGKSGSYGMHLVKNAKAVITDSGGITEETTVMGIPCLTLRDNTERPETIAIGTNELIGTDPNKLPPALARLMKKKKKKGA